MVTVTVILPVFTSVVRVAVALQPGPSPSPGDFPPDSASHAATSSFPLLYNSQAIWAASDHQDSATPGSSSGARAGSSSNVPQSGKLNLPRDAEPTLVDVWIERTGANPDGWPGKNADGTALVGRIPLAGGAGTCCVVSRQAPVTSGSAKLEPPTEEQLAWMQDRARQGRLYGTVIGALEDGTVVLLDGRYEA
jgi:hypothetical protein